MLAGFKNCLALLVCSLLLLAMRSPASTVSFDGMDVWETENPDYSMLSRIVIDKDEECGNGTRIRKSEQCVSTNGVDVEDVC